MKRINESYGDVMLKNTLITIYILSVLLISVIARAEFSSFDHSMAPVIRYNSYELQQQMTATKEIKYSHLQVANEIQLPVQTESYEGVVVFVEPGNFVLVNANDEYVNLESASDLTIFVGYNVVVQGIEQFFKPAYLENPISADPLPANGDSRLAPTIRVIGISRK